MDSDLESKLSSLISHLRSELSPHGFDSDCDSDRSDESDPNDESVWKNESDSKITSRIMQIISVVRCMDFDSLPKPESKLISLVTQTITLFNSMRLDSLPKPLSELISLISQRFSTDLENKSDLSLSPMGLSDFNIKSRIEQTLIIKPDPELISLLRQIFSLYSYKVNLISLRPKLKVWISGGKYLGTEEVKVEWKTKDLWNCFLARRNIFRLTGEHGATHFHCIGCNGECHKKDEIAPPEIKHPLHQKHYLQLALNFSPETSKCYCCDEDLKLSIYHCSACNFAMNVACVEKAPLLSIISQKWHEHTLALFPSQTSLPCNVCALTHTTCPFYICPPCDFVVHQNCLSLPFVIRISRHPHRISFSPFFDQGDWFCGVCRRKMDNDFGGYSCIKNGCTYSAHSRCATQSNLWDGIDLDGEPEEVEEEAAEPFVRIGDGIIRHFIHEDHHMRLDENTDRDYDDNKLCQACSTPIYFGNFYSCMQCDFVLHETCVNLPRKTYHPTHPHLLTLAQRNSDPEFRKDRCAACFTKLSAGFSYKCGTQKCDFQLHVHCATISEPLVHKSHAHPLFLTSKPGEERGCRLCRTVDRGCQMETFNCIECDDFSLCFKCAAIPQKVRYKHDKHILTLYYGEETDTMVYWCEACEEKIEPREGLYMCDEYCCVTLHITCLIGKDLYMKPGSSFSYNSHQHLVVLFNNHMSRPKCSYCRNRCQHKILFRCSELIFCTLECMDDRLDLPNWASYWRKK